MLELLNLIFGVGRKQLPSAAKILHDFATILKKIGTHSIYIGSAVPSRVDGRKHQFRKETSMHGLRKSILVTTGLLGGFLYLFYHYLYGKLIDIHDQ